MAKQRPTDATEQAPALPPGAVPAPDPERQALLDEIAALRSQLAQARGAAGVPYTPPAVTGGRELRPWMVSLDHIHKGLITPSPYFAQLHPDDPRGKPLRKVVGWPGDPKGYQPDGDELERRTAVAAAERESEVANWQRGQPIWAASEADAKAVFCQLHGIVSVLGQPPEARELTAEELERGEYGPPPQPGDRTRQTRVPEAPKKRKAPDGPTAARDEALADALQF